MSEVVVLTRAELEARRLRLVEQFPGLPKWWDEARDDCHVPCYRYSALAPDQGDALADYDEIQWLLGES